MVAVRHPCRFTEAEYLALEAAAEIRHEYCGGDIIGMAGAEPEHNQIVQNVRVELAGALGERPCRVTGSDQRVKVEATGEYFYPDVILTCLEPRYVDPSPRSLLNPQVIFEVLSPSTENRDRGEKWVAYQALPTLTDYVMIASDRRRIDHLQRADDESWVLRTLTEEGRVALKGHLSMDLERLYRLVTFER